VNISSSELLRQTFENFNSMVFNFRTEDLKDNYNIVGDRSVCCAHNHETLENQIEAFESNFIVFLFCFCQSKCIINTCYISDKIVNSIYFLNSF